MSLDSELKAAGLPVNGTAIEGQTVLFTRPLTDGSNGSINEVEIYESIVNPAAYRKSLAMGAAAQIPNWAHWTESQVLDWFQTNIETPLAAPIPANPMTVQQIRAVLVAIVSILGAMVTAMKAMARMIVALRDETWPNL